MNAQKFLKLQNKNLLKQTESLRGKRFYIAVFDNFSKVNTIPYYSQFADKVPSIAEGVIRTEKILLKKPVFEKGNASRIIELPSKTKQNNNTIHHLTKMTWTEISNKSDKEVVSDNVQDKREKRKPKHTHGNLVRTADFRKLFSKSDSTNWSHKLYTINEVKYDTIPWYRFNFLRERNNENLSRPT